MLGGLFSFLGRGGTENGQEDTMVTPWLAANAVKTRLKATSGDTIETPVAELTAVFAASSSSDGRRSLGLSENSVELLGDRVDVVADVESLGGQHAAASSQMDEEAVQRTEPPLARRCKRLVTSVLENLGCGWR